MIATIDIRTFISNSSKPRLPRRKDPLEVLREAMESLPEDLRDEIYSRRFNRQASKEGMGPIIVCKHSVESKDSGYNLPDIWFQISIPRSEVLNHRLGDLHGALTQIILNAFGDNHYVIRIDLDPVETMSKLYDSAQITG